jgi:hypothetical protein
MTIGWSLLAIPTIIWWRDSILWLAIMSLYANVVGHWGAYQAAHAERHNGETQDQGAS